MITEILLGLLLITFLSGIMLIVSFFRKKHSQISDGVAQITGPCGDTLEIRLDFKNNKVIRSRPRSNGCAHSFNCIYSASELAHGQSPDDILSLDKQTLLRKAGNIPKDHAHCADLALSALHQAARNYIEKKQSVN